MIRGAVIAGLLLACAARAAAEPAPAGAAVLAIDPSAPAELDAIRARLAGQRFTIAPDGRAIAIDDVAGEGRPFVGVVERRGDALWLRTAAGAWRLTGPLARPRLAGPGYAIWIVGTTTGDTLAARRLGVLRRPS